MQKNTFGTVISGTAVGTLVTMGTPGNGLYVTECSVQAMSGTQDVSIGFGTAIQGTGVLLRGAYAATGGHEKNYGDEGIYGGTSNLVYSAISGSGSTSFNVTYFTVATR